MKIKQIVKNDEVEFWGSVTSIIRDIMGSSVQSAYILLMTKTANESDSEILKFAKKRGEEIEAQYENFKFVNYDTNDIQIKFKTGKVVLLKCSEWGSIQNMS